MIRGTCQVIAISELARIPIGVCADWFRQQWVDV